MQSAGQLVVGIFFGAIVAIVGTIAHRTVIGDHDFPVGILEACALVLVCAIWIRAWAGIGVLSAYSVVFAMLVIGASSPGPGGNLLLTSELVSQSWVVAGLLMIALAFFLPRTWFQDVPIRRSKAGHTPPSVALEESR